MSGMECQTNRREKTRVEKSHFEIHKGIIRHMKIRIKL